jgi:hypothetical protein
VDVVARGLVLLADSADLENETHHLENAQRGTLADFVDGVEGVRACGFDEFLGRLEAVVDEPELWAALAEAMEKLDLYRGLAPQARARRASASRTRPGRLHRRSTARRRHGEGSGG